MSLLNDVMRDLQTRGVLGVPPLAGLHPVSGIPMQHRKRSHLLPALAALTAVTALVMWRPVGDGAWLPSLWRITDVAPAESEIAQQSVAEDALQPGPAIAATGDDLRRLFPIEDAGSKSRILDAGPALDPVPDAAPDVLASVAVPAAEPLAPVETAPVEAPPVIETPVAASAPVAESRSAIETAPPAAAAEPVTTSAKTTISRRGSDERDVDGIVARAMQAMRSRDPVAAERLLREALAIDPGNAETWTFLYGVLISASRPAAAEQALQQGLGAADQPAELAKLYARSLLDRGDRDAAVSVLAAHRPAPASDAEYDAFFAALLQQTGQFAQAGEVYQKLLTIDPNSGAWLVGLAMSHDSTGFHEEALIAFERALASGSLKSPLDRYARRRAAELKANE